MATLEKRRGLLEDLEVIENAISQRILRNPELYYRNVAKQALLEPAIKLPPASAIAANRICKSKKVRRSRKQLATQQHEIDLFLSQMLDKQKELKSLNGPVNTDDYEDQKTNFELLKHMVDEIDHKYDSKGDLSLDINEKIAEYEMFSASSKSKTILSEKARNLNINELFTRGEQYGEFMDIERFHAQWLNVIKRADCSLLQFFDILDKFVNDSEYLLAPPTERKNIRYGEFLVDLSNYMEKFFNKVYILVNSKVVSQHIETEFAKYLNLPILSSQNGCYCVTCGKWFKVVTVFQNHLPGKHHRKTQDKWFLRLFAEYKLHRYLNLLQKELQHTRDFVERKLAFTAEERMEEMARISLAYEEPDYADDEQNEVRKSKRGGPKTPNDDIELPMGPDGLPMPRWLFKLQGLDISYTCEICGNQSYKGRRMFEKHFSEPTHSFHLKCLGIEPSDAFKSITNIQEARGLWRRISGSSKTDSRDLEVEDEDGNVMTQQVYEELKKQGLA